MAITYLSMLDRQQSLLGGSGFHRAYTPYGILFSRRAPSLAYCGQLRDPSTGNYHLGNGHRTFNPRLMRFQSSDRLSPFGAGGPNAYAYCQGDPVNFHDPRGASQVRANLAMVAAGVGTAGADKMLHHGRKLMTIHMIEGLQKELVRLGRPDLTGSEVPDALITGHRKGLASSVLSGVMGWATGVYMNSVPEDIPAVQYVDVVMMGVVTVAVSASKYFDSVTPRPPVSLESKLEALQRHVEILHDPERGRDVIRHEGGAVHVPNTQDGVQSETSV